MLTSKCPYMDAPISQDPPPYPITASALKWLLCRPSAPTSSTSRVPKVGVLNVDAACGCNTVPDRKPPPISVPPQYSITGRYPGTLYRRKYKQQVPPCQCSCMIPFHNMPYQRCPTPGKQQGGRSTTFHAALTQRACGTCTSTCYAISSNTQAQLS